MKFKLIEDLNNKTNKFISDTFESIGGPIELGNKIVYEQVSDCTDAESFYNYMIDNFFLDDKEITVLEGLIYNALLDHSEDPEACNIPLANNIDWTASTYMSDTELNKVEEIYSNLYTDEEKYEMLLNCLNAFSLNR